MLKCGRGSINGLFVHLKAMHKITDFDSNNEDEVVKRQKILTSFLTPKSI